MLSVLFSYLHPSDGTDIVKHQRAPEIIGSEESSGRKRATGDSTGEFFVCLFSDELQRKLNSHLWGGGVKARMFGPIRHEELCLHQS